MSDDEPVTIYEAWNSFQARFLVETLAEAGIPARIASDSIEQLSGRVPFQRATCPVWVGRSDAARARAIVAEYERRLARSAAPSDDTVVPFCYHCGAPLAEQQPEACPRCRGPLDWSE